MSSQQRTTINFSLVQINLLLDILADATESEYYEKERSNLQELQDKLFTAQVLLKPEDD